MADREAKTFDNFDKLGLRQFADQLTQYLLVEHQFVEGSFVLSLNSEFGSGKTTFFEMWRNKLASAENCPEIIYVNAWESDFQGDALLAVVSRLLESLHDSKTEKQERNIKETAGKLCKFALSIGNDVVQRITGIDPIKAGQYAEGKGDKAESTPGQACFEIYRERQAVFAELRAQLQSLTSEVDQPIFVLIDELDRCRPTYAIEFLETIKHFFDIEGLIFVLGVDKGQLTSSAKALFGHDLDFDEYYRKFAHRNVNLPVKSEAVTKRFCTALAKEYLSNEAFEERGRFSHIKQDESLTEKIVDLCTVFSLNARQIHEFFRIAAHVFSGTGKGRSPLLLWGWHVSTFFMVALYVKNNDFYHRIGREEVSLEEFTAFLLERPLDGGKQRHGFRWAALLYLGAFGGSQFAQLEQQFVKLGVWEPSASDKDAFKTELGRFREAYSHSMYDSGEVFSRIYETLEGLRAFAED